MKKLLLFLSGIIIGTTLLAQVPQGISHQAVMRDADDNLIMNSPIGLQVSILMGAHDGEAVYVETHNVVSDQYGLITYIIGEGSVVEGVFENIDWADETFWLETKADPSGGTNYTITGLTRFLTVPYAMYAETFSGFEDMLARIEVLEDALGIDVPAGIVVDVDGNIYQTVTIGDQEWMAENLRVSKYKNGDAIPTGLTNSEWQSATQGAYAIFDNDEDMLEAYGKLYNWYAVDDSRGLCPEGWSVPSHDDWTQLVDYVVSQGYPNNSDNPDGAGNALKSCLQVNSPFEDCDTSEHPRWNQNDTHSGFDEFGFSGLPGGLRINNGLFNFVGIFGYWWSATEAPGNNAYLRRLASSQGSMETFSASDKTSGYSVRCFREISEAITTYMLNLEASPSIGGVVTGSGLYEESETVNIRATASDGWEFVEWTGETDYVDDPLSEQTTVTMPANHVNLTAIFQSDDDSDVIYGDGVTDIDGNEYTTVIIGDQEWMAENLRVTRYRNNNPIPAELSDEDWENTTEGAVAIYDYNNWDAEGIDSPEEMVEAYGKLYNWHAVNDARGLCPDGWHVPTAAEWTQLNTYLDAQGYTDHWDDPNGAGNALKSCRQWESPLGGWCDATEHPIWWSHEDHHGFDAFGFSGLPAGGRTWIGTSSGLGMAAVWWSATDEDDNNARSKSLSHGTSDLFGEGIFKNNGHSIRCIRSD